MKLQEEFSVSERRACRVIEQPRTSQRYQARPRDDERALVKRMLELVRQRPRFGAASPRCSGKNSGAPVLRGSIGCGVGKD